MDFAILGPLRACHRGQDLALGRPKQKVLLAVLLLHPGEAVSVERLAGDLWDQAPPRDLTGSLQAHVSRLRSALAAGGEACSPPIVTSPPGYRIDLAGHDLDADRFRALVRAGRDALGEGRHEEALARVDEAGGLWRGPPLAELSLGSLALAGVARLTELRLGSREDAVEALLALGRHRDALDHLDSLLPDDPLRERLWALRITALYRSGRQAEALRACSEVRRALAEELGIAPGPELQDLEAAVLAQRPELSGPALVAPAEPRPLVAAPAPERAGNLPAPLTTFVGRVRERADVAGLLGRHRLVSLVGFGGAGKTRLALEVAGDVAPSVPGGCWFVDLSATVDASAVGRAVATVLGVAEDPFRPLVERLADALRSRELLVVLDNCEHLVRACAELAGCLLRRCPDLRIMATSREPLGVPGEAHVQVPPLRVPGAADTPDAASSTEAVQLFVDRARLVRRDFVLTPENGPAVVSLCRRLEGIPLAIELAAARLAVLSPQQIDQRLGRQFRLLADEDPGRPARQRTLAATIAWSDALLDAVERLLLWRLSVFAGGFGLDAAEAVCAGAPVQREALLDHLSHLVARSLVAADTTGAEARYRLLETIRQHGAERLAAAGETQGVRAGHARWFLSLAERAEPELGGPAQEAWLAKLALDHDNLRAALAWAVAHDEAAVAQRLAGALALYWRVRGHVPEGREWLAAALSTPGEVGPAVRAQALWGAGLLATMAGDHEGAVPALEESTRLWQEAGEPRGAGRSLLVLGNSRRFTDGPFVASLLLEEAVTLARQAGDAWCLAHGLALAGNVRLEEGNMGMGEEMLAEALDVATAAGDAQGRRLALWGLGQLRLTQGCLGAAGDVLADGLGVSRRLCEPHAVASFAAALAEVHRLRGEHDRAAELLDEALVLAPGAGPMAEVEARCGQGALALARGDAAGAREWFAEALGVARGMGSSSISALLGLAASSRDLGDAADARRCCDEATALAEGVANRRGRAGALELAGRLAGDDGRDGEAWGLLGQSLGLYREAGDVAGMIRAVAALGTLAQRGPGAEHGASLLAAAGAARHERGFAPSPAAVEASGAAPPGLDAAGGGLDLGEAVELALRLADAHRSPSS